MKKIILPLTFLLASFSLQAQDLKPELCPDRLLGYENIQIQQSLSGDGKRCYLGIHPRDAFETLIYRDYLLTQDGLFMVFNSYSPDPTAASDGAREFFFLTNEFKGFAWNVENDSLVVTGFSDRVLKFSLKTAQLIQISGAQVQVADRVSPHNKGGVEILNTNFPFVDSGFRIGNSPSIDKNGSSTLKNSENKSCRLKNTKVFDYQEDKSAYLRSREQLYQAAQANCPGFVF